MTSEQHRISLLSRFDYYSWYFFLAWFGIVTFWQLFLDPDTAVLGLWGVLLVLGTTVLRLILLGEEFRRRRRMRLCLASYGLVILLGAIVVVQLMLVQPR